jgi:hypothetical protein
MSTNLLTTTKLAAEKPDKEHIVSDKFLLLVTFVKPRASRVHTYSSTTNAVGGETAKLYVLFIHSKFGFALFYRHDM